MLVIPGRDEVASPESITPVLMFETKRCHREYGFRVHAKTRAPE